jgi:hypothetical protein
MQKVADKGFSMRSNLGSLLRVCYDYAVLTNNIPSSPAVAINTSSIAALSRALSRDQIRDCCLS